jgi:NADH-quinone oxidoreductase subunit E
MAVKAKAREKLSFTAIDFIAHKHNVQLGAVIPALQEIQDTYGYIPPLAIERLAANIGVPTSEVYGIVTFYAQFRLEPLGDNVIKVCHGTACHLSGAEKIAEVIAMATGAKEGKTSQDGKFTVERVACIGCCSLAPCMMVNNEVHGRLTPEAVNKVVSQIQ